MEENLVVEIGDQFTSYVTPLVQQPPMGDTSFHGPMEGHVDSPVRPDYGPDAPFWELILDRPLLHLEYIGPLLSFI